MQKTCFHTGQGLEQKTQIILLNSLNSGPSTRRGLNGLQVYHTAKEAEGGVEPRKFTVTLVLSSIKCRSDHTVPPHTRLIPTKGDAQVYTLTQELASSALRTAVTRGETGGRRTICADKLIFLCPHAAGLQEMRQVRCCLGILWGDFWELLLPRQPSQPLEASCPVHTPVCPVPAGCLGQPFLSSFLAREEVEWSSKLQGFPHAGRFILSTLTSVSPGDKGGVLEA